MSLAPIILFVYNRPIHTKKVLDSLSKNKYFEQSKLYIYSDGEKNEDDIKKVNDVRDIINKYDFCLKPEIIQRENNLGLSKNIVSGVTEILENFNHAIILEDDIQTSPLFLEFMNSALKHYADHPDVWHISGWNYPNNFVNNDDFNKVFFWKVMNCWGWGTWAEKWRYYDKNPTFLMNNWSKKKIREFNIGNKFNFWKQVEENYNGKIDTWAIFWMTTIFENSGFCLNPINSYVVNIGHDNTGQNSTAASHFDSELSTKQVNLWPMVSDNFDLIIDNITNQNFKETNFNTISYIKNYLKKNKNLKFL